MSNIPNKDNALLSDLTSMDARFDSIESVLADRVTDKLLNIDVADAGTSLSNGVYTRTISGNTTFTLPSNPTDGQYYQIELILNITSTSAVINWGTTTFFNGETPAIETTGYYRAYWSYNPTANRWCCGVVKEGA